jgi:hypothetical protein
VDGRYSVSSAAANKETAEEGAAIALAMTGQHLVRSTIVRSNSIMALSYKAMSHSKHLAELAK